MATIAELLVKIEGDITDLSAKLDKAQGKIGDAEKATESWNAKFTDIGKKMALAGAVITGALGLVVKSYADVGDELDLLNQQTGISVENLSEFTLALEKSDLDAGSFAKAMKALASSMVEAKDPTSGAAGVFKDLGVEVKNADGTLRPMKDVLLDVATSFSQMAAGADKNKIAVELFSRAGLDMVHFLNFGKDGLQENIDKAHKLGLTWTTESATAADHFKESVIDLEGGLKGAKNQIAEALLPTLQKLVDKITAVVASIVTWIDAHPGLTKVLTVVVAGIGALLTGGGSLALLITKAVIPAVGALGAAFTFLAANPIVLVIAGLAALGIAIYKVVDAMNEASGKEGIFNEQNRAFAKALTDAGAAAGLTAEELAALEKSHNGNINKIAEHILQQKELTPLKYAFISALEKEGYSLEQIKTWMGEAGKATDEFGKSTGGVLEKTKTLKEELSLVFVSDLRERIGKVTTALELYKGKLAPEKERELREELDKLGAQVQATIGPTRDLMKIVDNMATGPCRDLSGVLKTVSDRMDSVGYYADTLEGQMQKFSDETGYSAETLRVLTYELLRLQMQAAGITLPDIRIPEEVVGDTREKTDTLKGLWDGLFNEVSSKWGDVVGDLIDGTTSVETAWNRLWKTLWETVKDYLGKKITEEIIKGIQGIIGESKRGETEAGGAFRGLGDAVGGVGNMLVGLATTVGTVLTTLVTAIGTAATTLATAIGSVIVTLATAIATAIETLAAASPALLEIGLVAAAIYTAFKLGGELVNAIGNLIGGGGEQADVTYWLKMIKDLAQEDHDRFLTVANWLFNEAWPTLYSMRDAVVDSKDILSGIQSTLWSIEDWAAHIHEALVSIPSMGAGGVVHAPTLAYIGESGAEAVVPLSGKNYEGAVGEQRLVMEINGVEVPLNFKNRVARLVLDLVPEMTKDERLLIHPRAVRAF